MDQLHAHMLPSLNLYNHMYELVEELSSSISKTSLGYLFVNESLVAPSNW